MQSVVAHQVAHPTGNDADTDCEVTLPRDGGQKNQHAQQRGQCEAKGVLIQSSPGGDVVSETTPPGSRLVPAPLVLADINVSVQ